MVAYCSRVSVVNGGYLLVKQNRVTLHERIEDSISLILLHTNKAK